MSKSPPGTASIIDPLDRNVWGAAAMGEVIGKTTGQTFYLLENGLIDADKVGRQWRSTPRRLLAPGHVAALQRRQSADVQPTSAVTTTPSAERPPSLRHAAGVEPPRRGRARKSAPIAAPSIAASTTERPHDIEATNTP